MSSAAGCIPIVGYNTGAGRNDRTKRLFKLLLLSEAAVGAAALVVVECFPRELIAIFGAANESEYYTLFALRAFRIYLSQDMTGVEVCGAMKNVIAIVCGISAGTGAGDNTLALIMTRGLAEISRLVHARGGQAMTCMGLAGMGDLIATCTSEHSRNRTFGYEFAHGVSLDEYQTRTHMVVEGAVAARSVSELARSLGVDIPLTFAVEQTLYNGVTLDRALEILTDRVPSQEFYGLTD